MKHHKILFVILIALTVLWAGISFTIEEEENSWICRGGKWVPYGNPTVPRPAGPCY